MGVVFDRELRRGRTILRRANDAERFSPIEPH
jgi:hypothetical protein